MRVGRRAVRLFLAMAVLVPLTSATTGVAPAAAATPRKLTAWLPYWDQARGLQSFLANADLYNALSPFWYQLATATRVTAYAGAGDPTVLDAARTKGVPVIPTVDNANDPARVTAMLKTDKALNAHVNTLVSLVRTKGYDGLDVDYESMAAADRSRFSTFITRLASSLHGYGKQLTVAVHAKTAEPGTWSGPQAQDYGAIGRAADRVRVMTYDYSWTTSAAGPIAPLGWVAAVAKFAASVIPPAKVELGVPLYGYDWVGSHGVGVTYDQVQALLSTYAVTPVWDAVAAEHHFSYVAADGAGHEVWYGDATSVASVLTVADTYALAGVACWRLGGEDAGVWPVIRSHWTV